MHPVLMAGGGFSPLALPSLAGWWDASDTTSITASSGAVSQWNDKSGNNRHLAQATSTYKPVTGATTRNGRNVLDFDGSNDVLSFDAGSNAISLAATTVIMALTVNSNTTNARMFTVEKSAVGNDYASGSGLLAVNISGNFTIYANTQGATRTLPLSSWFLGRTTSSGTSTTAATNSTSSSAVSMTSGISTVRYLHVGVSPTMRSNTPSFLGSIGELILCSAVLGSTDIALAEAYLKAKWNTP